MKFDKSASQRLLQDFGGHRLGQTLAFVKDVRFKAGRVSVQDVKHSDCIRTCKTPLNIGRAGGIVSPFLHRKWTIAVQSVRCLYMMGSARCF